MRGNYRRSINYLIKRWFSDKRVSTDLQGFTLLELMVVLFFMGTLAAVAIPVFVGQVGKSREAELLLTIGTMARSQQSYHHLYGKFALSLTELENDSGPILAKYHDVDNITGDPTKVKMQAIALNPGKDQVRDYAVGVYFKDGAYTRATCQGELVGSAVQVGDLPSDPCTNNGNKIY